MLQLCNNPPNFLLTQQRQAVLGRQETHDISQPQAHPAHDFTDYLKRVER